MAKSSTDLEKQFAVEDMEVQTNQMEIGTPLLEQETLIASAANAPPSKFVSAATMATTVPEITDEELLKFVLEFERKHSI